MGRKKEIYQDVRFFHRAIQLAESLYLPCAESVMADTSLLILVYFFALRPAWYICQRAGSNH